MGGGEPRKHLWSISLKSRKCTYRNRFAPQAAPALEHKAKRSVVAHFFVCCTLKTNKHKKSHESAGPLSLILSCVTILLIFRFILFQKKLVVPVRVEGQLARARASAAATAAAAAATLPPRPFFRTPPTISSFLPAPTKTHQSPPFHYAAPPLPPSHYFHHPGPPPIPPFHSISPPHLTI